jgi:hypothetical protein
MLILQAESFYIALFISEVVAYYRAEFNNIIIDQLSNY